MVRGDSLKIFVHVKSHDSLYIIVNQDNTINNTLLCIINRDTKRHRVTFNTGLKVKGRKNGKTEIPSPCRRNRTLCAINLCQDATLRGCTKMKPPFLPFDEPNLCNDYILRDSEYIDRF